ncbi:MAG: hypothetical protein PHX44_01700 [Sulfurimonas sp.]|uniref:hypothetical protein n=1 Tax=Sulfurimonas sp. TaxID=2022749 RepID=UPI00262177C5|nr:hypothetical protein [Sulfurimonas sp.]MDD2651732.1 hypothetical protein [Sulfurimonas sp.]MDD2651749.1 hypothetical protein [Sulfurimonas sp.]MDD3451699.1 hypothetical protein [Sulfurimonas sp.]MDD3451716.1 hypothetical protein [Sulfurimonas sp.]
MFTFQWLMPLVFDLIRGYINSTSSKSDDEVLSIIQYGASYLANKDNNTLSKYDADLLLKKEMK